MTHKLDKRGALEPIASNRASTGRSYSFPGLRDEPFFLLVARSKLAPAKPAAIGLSRGRAPQKHREAS
jgi:hypothetical protein